MRTYTSLLMAVAALLATTIPACATSPATPSGTSWEVPHFTFEPLSAAKQAELRHAIANCARVEMSIHWLAWHYSTCNDKHWRYVETTQHSGKFTWKQREWVREFLRGAELDAILNKLSAVQQWYAPVFDKRIRIHPGRALTIRLLDAEGKELYSEDHAYGPWTSCMGEQGERISFTSFFPEFPDRKCFGQ